MTREDAISRQAVKEQMIKYGFHAPDITVTEFVEDLPSVKPQEPITDRIEYGTDGNSYKLTISNGKEFNQEPILDKIRAEIAEQIIPRSSYTDKQKKQVLEIIDKYRGDN